MNFNVGKTLRVIILLLAVLYVSVALSASDGIEPELLAPRIAENLVDSLSFDNPVILDVRCGEWTPALERELRKVLLSRKVDLRETSFGMIKDNNDLLPLAMETDYGIDADVLLQMLDLKQADYLELSLQQSVEQGEQRNLISYSRYRMPVYTFVLKQIALPEQRLNAIREYKLNGEKEVENPGSLLSMKWYEPILASAILGSLVYMLWTIK